MINKQFTIGDPVTYWPFSNKTGKSNIGIIKSFPNDKQAWVVFHYSHDPNNYLDYTAQLCNISNLQFGWQYHIFQLIPNEHKPIYYQWITDYFIRTGYGAIIKPSGNFQLLEDQVDEPLTGFP